MPGGAGCAAGLKVSALVAGMVAGADSIDDMDPLRHGGMRRPPDRETACRADGGPGPLSAPRVTSAATERKRPLATARKESAGAVPTPSAWALAGGRTASKVPWEGAQARQIGRQGAPALLTQCNLT